MYIGNRYSIEISNLKQFNSNLKSTMINTNTLFS